MVPELKLFLFSKSFLYKSYSLCSLEVELQMYVSKIGIKSGLFLFFSGSNVPTGSWYLGRPIFYFRFSHFSLFDSEWIGFPGGSEGKVSACNAGDQGSISELGRSSGEGNGNPL